MNKFTKLSYNEVETKKVSEFESSFSIKPLERGFGNTLGNALRRVLLSSISGVAPFAVKIAGATHEFQTLTGVNEDVVQLILNLKNVRFVYNTKLFKSGEVIKVTLKSSKGEVYAKDFILPPGVEIVNLDAYIATATKAGALELELFLTSGRGFVSFEENKDTIKKLQSKIDSKISGGASIAMDSDFSPVVNVSYEAIELNSSSVTIEEKLTLNVKTDGSVEAKDALATAAHILIEHLSVVANVSNLEKDEIFQETIEKEELHVNTAIAISQLDLSVRSYNCLKRAGFVTLEDLASITMDELEQIKNLGKKSVQEIIEKLAEHDVKLQGGE